MKLVWKGKMKSLNDLPKGELPENAVVFKEPETPEKFNLAATFFTLPVTAFAVILFFLKSAVYGWISFPVHIAGVLASFLAVLPHELLHAVCFPKDADVGIYYSPKNLMMFVMSVHPVSKARFILLSLLPSMVFGLAPMVIWLFVPDGPFWHGTLFTGGFLSLLMGSGDYVNAVNALRQMPKGAYTQPSGFHSYWFMPADRDMAG